MEPGGCCHLALQPDRGLVMSNIETVRAMFASYLAQDREEAERLVADEFVFTSPQDDHIDRAAFFERCFPTADRLVCQELRHVVATEGDDVFVMYEYELKSGERHRNVELLTVRGQQIVETQVFFGGRVN
jgi:ketosteroid isomerase-like protein